MNRIGFLIITASLFNLGAHASNTCRNPFKDPQHFYLNTGISKGGDNGYSFYVADDDETREELNGVVVPECINESTRVMNVYMGTIEQAGNEYDYIAYDSNAMSCHGIGRVEISDTCSGKIAYIVDGTHGEIQVDGNVVHTSFRVYANDEAESLIAYVALTDDAANEVVISNMNGQAATAKKTENQAGFFSSASASWEINNPDEIPAVTIAYILSLKDNQFFSCTPSSNNGLLIATVIATGAYLTCAIPAGIGLSAWWVLKNPYLRNQFGKCFNKGN